MYEAWIYFSDDLRLKVCPGVDEGPTDTPEAWDTAEEAQAEVDRVISHFPPLTVKALCVEGQVVAV